MTGRDHCQGEERLSVREFRHVLSNFHVTDQGQVRQILVRACLHRIAIVGLEVRLRHPYPGLWRDFRIPWKQQKCVCRRIEVVSAIYLVPDGSPTEHSATLTVLISEGSCPCV